MIIQLSAVPKADKSIIIAAMCKAAYKRLFGFRRIWLVHIIFRSFSLCEYLAVSVCVCSCLCIHVAVYVHILHIEQPGFEADTNSVVIKTT